MTESEKTIADKMRIVKLECENGTLRSEKIILEYKLTSLQSELDKKDKQLEVAIQALNKAGDVICSECCGTKFHHKYCIEAREALKQLEE